MQKKLQQLKAQRAALLEKSKRDGITDEELKTIRDEMKKINESIALINEIVAESGNDDGDNANGDDNGNADDGSRGAAVGGVASGEVIDNGQSQQRFRPVFDSANARSTNADDNKEYREAFRARVERGVAIPAELRDATATSDVGDVIPENLIAQIIDRSLEVGTIFKSVLHTSYPVGQEYPKASFRPVVSYVTEGSGSATQKAGTTDGKIQFSHYKADCRIAWTEETARMTLDQWEKYFVERVIEAITKWKENEIINGTGSENSHVTGILTQTPEFALTKDTLTYEDLLEFEGNLPAAKDSGAKWYMAKKTFFNTFKSILDDNGNPVAAMTQGTDGKIKPVILGREVVYIDEYISNHKGAGVKAGAITAFMYDFKDYVFNENYNLGIKRRENWDNDNQEMKAVFSCDGKPLYTDSLIVLKRATDVA